MDYAPFGMILVGRSVNSTSYRYAYNGKEKDKEVYGEGNIYDYGMRIYNPRIGRFLSQDPITYKYPDLSPYQYASNSPIALIDIDGLEGGKPAGKGTLNIVLSPEADLEKIRSSSTISIFSSDDVIVRSSKWSDGYESFSCKKC